ncbi:thiamine-phosphate pyrophosphorylase [Scopulibacillus daqui]|uniref:Thiamine-phosphate synthase n=1 Tax=Scopulibacillus daqui TaxID=1469162 RepID=A0ABS2Q0Y6_9BACL|nr:thiamine phosphate synthase [Scopulibacillus daqui]MBM7645958.1 thiamine-phosphate pyrophosphorylase [Scopulibacillus daqui]
MADKHADYSVYLVTENYDSHCSDQYMTKIKQALEGGISLLQLRAKHASSKVFYELAEELKSMAHACNVPLIINDRVDIALAVDADGIHVGQDDLPAGKVRKIIGPDKILGVSCSTVEEAIKAEQDGADYLGCGSVFPTKTKSDATMIELDELKRIKENVSIPVVAIGGITEENVNELLKRNVDGIAVVSAILSQPDVKKAAKILNEKMKKAGSL